jgi:hypothetical protein
VAEHEGGSATSKGFSGGHQLIFLHHSFFIQTKCKRYFFKIFYDKKKTFYTKKEKVEGINELLTHAKVLD